MTEVWAGPTTGWAYLVSVLDYCTREIVGWDLSLRCRTQEAISALERAVLETLAAGPGGCNLVLNTDNGTQFTSARFIATLGTGAEELHRQDCECENWRARAFDTDTARSGFC